MMRGTSWWVFVVALVVMGCGGGGGNSDGSNNPPCSDGVDNDDDGMTDFPDDLGCGSETDETEDGSPAPQCDDNRDNDGDGKKDYPEDPGCFAKQADDESDDCPDGPGCAQCSNGKDDDGNGTIDFPADSGCESAADNSEFFNNAAACGPGMKIKQLPPDGIDVGQLEMGSTSNIVSPCGGGAGAFAVAYVLHLTEPKVIVASTDMPGTAMDTVIDIRGQMCTEASAELACNDDISTGNQRSKVTQALDKGVYYIIVQERNVGIGGSYQLQVDKFAGEGTPCTTQAACGPGLYCRTPHGGSQMVCSKAVCNDGLDDDGDTKIDYPNDPGCSTPEDDTENDSCPSGAGCPECGDGIDNDNDTKTDYPMDTTCKAAGDSSESCTTTEGVVLINTAVTTGDTTNATSDINPTCASLNNSGPDRHYRLDVPALQSLSMNMTASFDTSTVLLNSNCGGTAIACSDPLNMTTGALAAGTYYFVVDGYYSTSKGTYTINTSGKIANGAACDAHALSQIGALTCGNGYACKGTAGSKTCQPAQCGDGMDNNGNGKTDYPADPGCTSTSDDTETTVCPGAQCPVCSNLADDDMDGLTDYPADTSCIAASGNNESCTSTEPVINVTTAATMGDTSMATDDLKLPTSCQSSTSTARDLHHKIALPAMSTVTLSLSAKTPAFWDSTIALFNSSCGGTPLSCQDSDTMTLTNLAAGNYFFAVDGWSTASGAYTLNVAGKIANGGSCESALAQSGAITCGLNYACKGATGSKTCQLAQCADGIDNNGAGGIDYPNDPGCSSSSDDTETTVCPGAMCPVCANGADDDTDGKIDYPMDFGCAAASGSTEVFCTGEPDVAMNPITTAATTGDTTTTADNYDQTCQSSTGNDMAFALQLPVAVASLVIDTEGSTITDTVLSMKDSSCGTQLGCDDDAGTGNLSKMTVLNVPPGNYAIQVDGYSTTNNGPFTLNVKGTVAPMTSCTSPLFAAGVLACPTGTTCTGTPQRCQ
jgi:hypothetical protein